jgi:hypothetical protein
VTLAAAGLLAVLAFVGTYVRPTSDDWCAVWKTREMGVFGITEDFYLTQNGRIANAFVTGLVNFDGLTGMKVFPGLLIVTLGGGLVVILRELWALLGWRSPLLMLVAVAAVIEVLLFAAAPNPYQALLWAPATISHTLPIIIAVWAIAMALRAGRSAHTWIRTVSVVVALLLGFFLGTLNEPFVVMAGLAGAAAGLLLLPWFKQVRSWYPVTWLVTAGAGLMIGYAVLYTSPGAEWRRAQNTAAAPLLSGSNLSGAYQDWLKVLDVLAAQWTYLAVVAIGLAAGLVVRLRSADQSGDEEDAGLDETVHIRPGRSRVSAAAVLILPIPVLLLGSYVIILGVRQGYGPSGWTYHRTWFSFVAPMVFTLCLYGVAAGRALQRVLESRRNTVTAGGAAVAVTLLASFALYPIASLVPEVRKITTVTVTRATAWDKQDKKIRRQVRKGATEVKYQPLTIGNLAEPFFTRTYSRDWVAACASGYYRVDKINR